MSITKIVANNINTADNLAVEINTIFIHLQCTIFIKS